MSLPDRRSAPYKPKRFRWVRVKLFAKSQLNRFPLIQSTVIRIWRTGRLLFWKCKWKLVALIGTLRGTYVRGIDVDQVCWISPQWIIYCSLQEFDIYDFKGRIIGGDWDRLEKKFEDLDIYIALKQVCMEGKDWQETAFYQRVLDGLSKGRIPWDCRDASDFDQRCKGLEILFQKIKCEGYKSQGELLLSQQIYDPLQAEEEVTISIGRRGDLLFSDGAHRLAIAKLLDIPKIPVKIAVRHPEWVRLRKEERQPPRQEACAYLDMKTLTREIRRKIHSRIFIDYEPGYRNSVLLAGSGRSGTTWVSDIINYKNEYRYIFEPFHPYQVNFFGRSHIRQYLRPDNREEYFIEQAQAILSGKIKSRWTNKFNRKFLCDKRLIKAVRANLLLKWIHASFPGVSIILLLRHPCAVAHSQLTLHSWPWDTDPEQFLAQEELMEDFLNPFRGEMENVHTDFEKHILLWCVENYVPLKQFKRDEIHLAFYENFCKKPKHEIDILFSFLSKSYDATVLADLRRPSQLIRENSAIVTGGSLVDSWREHVTNEQIQRAVEILRVFGLDRIYSQDSMPDVNNAYSMMKPS